MEEYFNILFEPFFFGMEPEGKKKMKRMIDR
jgi:hypothetical protein